MPSVFVPLIPAVAQRILVINPFGVGDVLFTTPVLRGLKAAYPGCRIAYLCNEQVAALLRHNPCVEELLFFSRGDFKKLRRQSVFRYAGRLLRAIATLRQRRFDLAVDLSLVSQYSFVLRLLGVPVRWGFDYRGRGRSLTHTVSLDGFRGRHVTEYYADLLRAMGITPGEPCTELFLSPEDVRWAERFLSERKIRPDKPLIGIAAFGGASWGAQAHRKQWPAERFAAAARTLSQETGATLLLFGVESERAACEQLAAAIAATLVVNAAGQTSLGQLAGLIQRCDLVLANDGGPAHITAALGVNCVSIFGPVDEKVYGPAAGSRGQRALSAAISCRPCYQQFSAPDCPALRCLEAVSVAQVLAAGRQLLAQPGRAQPQKKA